MDVDSVKASLNELADPLRAKNSAWYFKTGKGQYGEGDQFIGVSVGQQRAVAKAYARLAPEQIIELLHSPVHEHRLTALFILVNQYRIGDSVTKKQLASLYHKNRGCINSWDLVDSSAPYILGDYFKTHSPNVLFRLASSKSLWDRRIAIMSTFALIKDGEFDLTFKIATMLLGDKEDLIHKATGWSLREVGKKNLTALLNYLDKYAAVMPRTSLRYAIERLSDEQRQHYLNYKRQVQHG